MQSPQNKSAFPLFRLLFASISLFAAAGCNMTSGDNTLSDSAITLNFRGVAAKDRTQARQFFEQAARKDTLYGPAFSNLGLVYLQEGDYFHAASAFDQAINLMPQSAMPRLYLGLVYENVGQLENARTQFSQALDLAPDDMKLEQAATRANVKLNQIDQRTIERLRHISCQGTSEYGSLGQGKF